MKINLLEDTELCEVLDHLISGLLPHENYDSTMFSTIVSAIFSYVKLDEMEMEYYVLGALIQNFYLIKVEHSDAVFNLTRPLVEQTLTNRIPEIIRREEVGMSKWLESNGLRFDLDDSLVIEDAKVRLYQSTMELFDRAYALAIDSKEALTVLPSYKSLFIAHAARKSVEAQVHILEGSYRVGRKVYTGSEDWMRFSEDTAKEIKKRTDNESKEGITLDDVSKSDDLLDELVASQIPLCDYGISVLDDKTPILRHRLVVIAADENVGKTTVAVAQIARLLQKKRKVFVMCGETSSALYYAMILNSYIYLTSGVFISIELLGKRHEMTDQQHAFFERAVQEINGNKLLRLEDELSYEGLYEELVTHREKFEFDAIYIDHSKALTGKADERTNISMLAVNARRFKKKFPVYVCILSHLSVLAHKSVAEGEKVKDSPTAGGRSLSNEADEIFVLSKNDTLTKQSLLSMQVYKRRLAESVTQLLYLKMKWHVRYYEFNENEQAGFKESAGDAVEAMNRAISIYGSDEDGDDEDPEY